MANRIFSASQSFFATSKQRTIFILTRSNIQTAKSTMKYHVVHTHPTIFLSMISGNSSRWKNKKRVIVCSRIKRTLKMEMNQSMSTFTILLHKGSFPSKKGLLLVVKIKWHGGCSHSAPDATEGLSRSVRLMGSYV